METVTRTIGLFCMVCLVAMAGGCGDDGDSSSITTVTAGDGLEGGGSEGEVTLSADTSYLQRRIEDGCSGNAALQLIGSDGSVNCSAEMALATHDHEGEYAAADHNHDGSYAAVDHDHAGEYAAADHNHDGSYAPLAHNHDGQYAPVGHNHDDRYVSKQAFTGHSTNDCVNDTGFMIIGNVQEEFGCHLTCNEICERHGMVCDRAYSWDGSYRTCESINNSDALYCWCRG